MRNKKLFNKTISILVNAYLKVTLIHSDACACAIGNLIAAYNNYIITKISHKGDCLMWKTKEGKRVKVVWYGNEDEDCNQLKCTRYSIIEIAKIEKAFESPPEGKDQTGYEGLMKVVDTLIDIHQGTEDHKKETKELFKITG